MKKVRNVSQAQANETQAASYSLKTVTLTRNNSEKQVLRAVVKATNAKTPIEATNVIIRNANLDEAISELVKKANERFSTEVAESIVDRCEKHFDDWSKLLDDYVDAEA